MENTKIKLENISSGKEQKDFNTTQKKYLVFIF